MCPCCSSLCLLKQLLQQTPLCGDAGGITRSFLAAAVCCTSSPELQTQHLDSAHPIHGAAASGPHEQQAEAGLASGAGCCGVGLASSMGQWQLGAKMEGSFKEGCKKTTVGWAGGGLPWASLTWCLAGGTALCKLLPQVKPWESVGAFQAGSDMPGCEASGIPCTTCAGPWDPGASRWPMNTLRAAESHCVARGCSPCPHDPAEGGLCRLWLC